MANLENAVEEMGKQYRREGIVKVKGKMVLDLKRETLEYKVNLSAN